MKNLKDKLARVYIVYGAFVLFLVFLWHTPSIMRNAVSQTISRLTPPINYFELYVEPQGDFNKDGLKECIYYHQKVAYFFPYQSPEANSMLGFCYYRYGRVDRAVQAYQRSLELNPVYFWSYYNLGVIAYNRKDYPRAYSYFRTATEQDMVKTMLIISQSKVYSDVIASDKAATQGYDVEKSVKSGYEKAYIGIMATLFKAEKYAQLLQFSVKNASAKEQGQDIYYFYAGLAAFHLKVFDKAAVLLEKSIELNGQNADAFLYMGLCLQAGGRNDLAREYLSTAAALHRQYGSFANRHEVFDVQIF